MKRKIRIDDLKRLLREVILREEDTSVQVPEEDGTSLDAQVDRFLGQYEAEAKTSKTEGFDFRMMTRRILNEAGKDDDTGDDVPTDDVVGDAAAPPSKIGLDKIDVENFTNSVVRLIDNYDSLLEVRNTLVRRAKNFLGKSYFPEVIDAFEKTLREKHGIATGESKDDVDAEDFPAPVADRAGEGGAGGAPA